MLTEFLLDCLLDVEDAHQLRCIETKSLPKLFRAVLVRLVSVSHHVALGKWKTAKLCAVLSDLFL